MVANIIDIEAEGLRRRLLERSDDLDGKGGASSRLLGLDTGQAWVLHDVCLPRYRRGKSDQAFPISEFTPQNISSVTHAGLDA